MGVQTERKCSRGSLAALPIAAMKPRSDVRASRAYLGISAVPSGSLQCPHGLGS